MPIIEVNHLTKEYQLGQLASIRETAINLLNRVQGRKPIIRERFKALDDISFKIDRGEVVGILGANGAGKSTLLKHLAHITKPTRGEVIVLGNVAPLIEVGSGINPELTGRENIFLNAAILGIPRKVIRQKLDEIIEFAELEEFIDTPVKRYSSGMQVRLGFSLATSMDADILIVDEVLAVGDLAFQRKCFERMESIIHNQDKTVLLVSHNPRQVSRICSRVILLNDGKIIEDGDPDSICKFYYERAINKIDSYHADRKYNHVKSSGEIDLVDIKLLNDAGVLVRKIKSNDALTISVSIQVKVKIKKVAIVVGTHTTDFIYLTANSTATKNIFMDLEPGIHEFICKIPQFPIKPGNYYIRLVASSNSRMIFAGDALCSFSVVDDGSEIHKPPLRTLDLPCEWIFEDGFQEKNYQVVS